MIQAQDFEFNENLFEFSYNLKIQHSNPKLNEVISIIKNKDDKYWYANYISIYGLIEKVPIDRNENEEIVINNVCEWYNKIKRN